MPAGLIVVVDDDPVIRKFYQEGLGSAGYTVLTAPTGEDGLALLTDHKPRIAILDINLPGMSGIELCEEVKRMRWDLSFRGRSVPILFVTSNDTLQVLHDCIAAGGDDFLIKGAPIKTILERCAYWSLTSTRCVADEQRAKALEKVEEEMQSDLVQDIRQQLFGGPVVALTEETNEDVRHLVAFVLESRGEMGANFGHTVKEKLYLLGYATGAVAGRSKVNIAMKLAFNQYLRATMLGAKFLVADEIDIMLENWHELYDNETFQNGCEKGESAYDAVAVP